VPPYIYAIFHFYFKFGIGNPKNGALTPGRVLLCMRLCVWDKILPQIQTRISILVV
jgi:hypothetical protein